MKNFLGIFKALIQIIGLVTIPVFVFFGAIYGAYKGLELCFWNFNNKSAAGGEWVFKIPKED